jgi:hypothetical protein
MARTRGIEWCFEYDQWVAWWVKHAGHDWMKKRGRRKGQYCMARRGDKGPYAPGNVDCISVSKNHHDGTFGKRRPKR